MIKVVTELEEEGKKLTADNVQKSLDINSKDEALCKKKIRQYRICNKPRDDRR
jgi:hypothetical protein